MNAALTPWRFARRQANAAPLRLAALTVAIAAALAVAGGMPVAEATALDAGLGQALARSGYVSMERSGITGFDDLTTIQRVAAPLVASKMGRYLGPGNLFASLGPLAPVTLNARPAPAAVAGLRLGAAFYGDLGTHVVVSAGELPPDGLGGDYPPVTMAQAGADRAGLHLSDVVCAAVADASTRWCARIVGLWRPISPSDTFWAGNVPGLVFAMGRYDFFQLLALRPAGAAVAGLHFGADAAALVPGATSDVEHRLAGLRAAVARLAGLTIRTSLDAELARYADEQRVAAQAISVVALGAGVLALCLVALAGSRFLEAQARDVALLRARGCPPELVWRILAAELGAGAVAALPIGLVMAAIAVVAVGQAPSGPYWPPAGIGAALVGLAAAVVGIAAVLGGMAALLATGAARPGPFAEGSPWRRRHADLVLAAAGLALLLALGLRPGGLLGNPGVDSALGAVLPVLAAAAIALGALRLLPVAGGLAASWWPDVAGLLARRQLVRRPDRHAGAAYVIEVAAALAAFAAVGLAIEPSAVNGLDALQRARQAALLLGLLTALAMAVGGFALHFRATARDRTREYSVLALHGLPATTVARSLAAEQLAVVGQGVAAGTVVGLAMAAAGLPGLVGPPVLPGAAGVVAAAAAWALLPVGLAAGGWLVLRAVLRSDLLDDLREAT